MMSFTLVGIVSMLLASAAFNGALIVWRVATRTLPAHTGAALLDAALTRRAGFAALVLSLLGWANLAAPFCDRHLEPGEDRARTTLDEPEGWTCEPCRRKHERP
jgi:hypothetical protein